MYKLRLYFRNIIIKKGTNCEMRSNPELIMFALLLFLIGLSPFLTELSAAHKCGCRHSRCEEECPSTPIKSDLPGYELALVHAVSGCLFFWFLLQISYFSNTLTFIFRLLLQIVAFSLFYLFLVMATWWSTPRLHLSNRS